MSSPGHRHTESVHHGIWALLACFSFFIFLLLLLPPYTLFPASHPVEHFLDKFLSLTVKAFNVLVFLFPPMFMIAWFFDLRLLPSPAPKMILFPNSIVFNTHLLTLESISGFLLCLFLQKLLIISDVICGWVGFCTLARGRKCAGVGVHEAPNRLWQRRFCA